MGGTRKGGIKARETNIIRYGKDYYAIIGGKGGKKTGTKGFALNPSLASKAGKIGGRISKRGKSKNDAAN